jgi:hypothetical protein
MSRMAVHDLVLPIVLRKRTTLGQTRALCYHATKEKEG